MRQQKVNSHQNLHAYFEEKFADEAWCFRRSFFNFGQKALPGTDPEVFSICGAGLPRRSWRVRASAGASPSIFQFSFSQLSGRMRHWLTCKKQGQVSFCDHGIWHGYRPAGWKDTVSRPGAWSTFQTSKYNVVLLFSRLHFFMCQGCIVDIDKPHLPKWANTWVCDCVLLILVSYFFCSGSKQMPILDLWRNLRFAPHLEMF